MKKHYCGPYWMPKFMRKWLSGKFNASCRLHDIHYEKMNYSRREADQIFLKNCLAQSNSSGTDIIAALFFIAVVIGGRLSYGKKK